MSKADGTKQLLTRVTARHTLLTGSLFACMMVFAPCALAVEGSEPDENEAAETPLTAGYEKNSTNGFFIRSKDGQFRLNIGLYTQARYDVNWREAPPGEDDVELGFSLNRTRVFLEATTLRGSTTTSGPTSTATVTSDYSSPTCSTTWARSGTFGAAGSSSRCREKTGCCHRTR